MKIVKNKLFIRFVSICMMTFLLFTVPVSVGAVDDGKAELCAVSSVTVKVGGQTHTFDGGLEPVIVPADVDWYEYFSSMVVKSYQVVESEDCAYCTNHVLMAYYFYDEDLYRPFLTYFRDGDVSSNRYDEENDSQDYQTIIFIVGENHDIDQSTYIKVRFEKDKSAPVPTAVPTAVLTLAPTTTPELIATPTVTIQPTSTPEFIATPAVTEQPTVTAQPTSTPKLATSMPTAVATSTPKVTPKPTAKVLKFTKKTVKIKKGKKVTLKVKLTGAKKAKFSTSKKKVVKIVKAKAKKVVVKGIKKGKATITAKAAGKKAKCKVVVKK